MSNYTNLKNRVDTNRGVALDAVKAYRNSLQDLIESGELSGSGEVYPFIEARDSANRFLDQNLFR